ncbi:PIN domain-containing protein [Ornithinimicrobium cryptoxanthini]|uniref:PIN domain-containing protein n=1 Tax=Ornithinimicrobium cryptoxanthini TaxID=2934161 RepID=UPI0021189371|nr:PIN domain-containing protein [Ornithinimicrobium cryptoxanthini]
MRRLVLDANILIRAVLGRRVRGVITTYAADVEFFAPSIAYDEAERHLPSIFTRCPPTFLGGTYTYWRTLETHDIHTVRPAYN